MKAKDLKLKGSLWMFNPEMGAYYANRYEFIQFIEGSKLEILSDEGEVMRIDQLVYQENGGIHFENDPLERAIKFLSYNSLEIIHKIKKPVDQEDSVRELKLNFSRIDSTKIDMDSLEVKEILTQSSWEEEREKQIIEFIPWKKRSVDEKKELMNDREKRRKVGNKNHLIKVSNSLVAIQEKSDSIVSKAFVKEISREEMILTYPAVPELVLKLKRLN